MGEEAEDLSSVNRVPLVTISDGASRGTSCLTEEEHDGKRQRASSDGNKRRKAEELAEDVLCGILCWKPQCLQRFNNPPCLLFFFSIYALSLGFVVNGINNVNTTAIEQRFHLTSATVGLISSAYDVSAAILGLLISYFGAGRHKARMVGIAVIISSLGSILMALPHFTTGPYSLGEDSATSLCLPLNSTARETSWPEQCDTEQENGLSRYLYMFIVGQMLHGVGGTTIYTVGVTLIDDSVRPSTTPLYLGILYGSAVLGPGLGYVVGGQFLSYYVDFDIVDTKMTPEDPRWVGAWWLGFILASAVNLLVSLPILCFGAELPSAKHIRQIRVSQAHTQTQEQKETSAVLTASRPERSLKHFVQTSLTLLSNPCFLCISLSMVSESISLSGVATFLPKMIEKKFRVSASKAAMLSGLAVVPSAASGQFLGGFVAQRMKLSIPGLIKLCIVGFLLTLLFVGIVWIDCGREEFVGVTVPYPLSVTQEDITLMSSCNAACHCSTDVFIPVCDHNNTMYFSPCHAGCTSGTHHGLYINCSCLAGGGMMGNLTVQSTGCREACDILYPFIVLLFLLTGFSMIAVAPGDSVQLRCVPEEIKTFAQGLKQMIVRILGTVVGPIITGRMLDNTCQVWRQSCSGASLSCWLYDTDMMSSSAFFGVAGTKVLSIILCVMALRLYRPPKAPAHTITELDRLDERTDLSSVDLN
ncbi:solute carrier organic anion transporter family member 4C1-like [Babylonia areolata]|uniref:solute carrier organic anion transporter family member 4C1-like n=1 Tax=Babylonia areolata TaxID=304850 RepID=UPI003FD33E1E